MTAREFAKRLSKMPLDEAIEEIIKVATEPKTEEETA